MKSLRIIVVVLAFSLTALTCTSYVPTNYYQIDVELPVERAEKQFPLTMEVGNLRSPSRYKDQIVYRASDYRVGFYEYSQWVEPPAEMVRRALVNALKRADLFARVDPVGVIAAPDLVLQGGIVSFDQVLDKKGKMAECEIALEIIPGDGGKPIWSYTAKGMVEQKAKGPSGFVPAMAAAVDTAISETIKAMEEDKALQDLAEKKKSAPTPTGVAQ